MHAASTAAIATAAAAAVVGTASLMTSKSEVTHVALFRLSRPLNDDEIARIHTLAALVPGMISIRCGPNYTDRAGKFNFCITIRFESRSAEEAFRTDPHHEEGKAWMRPLMVMDADSPPLLVFDFIDKPNKSFNWGALCLLSASAGIVLGLATARRG
mmetsp:Transcript_33340/g.64309  ORF Transcript_33340/g.64309 Transcript_33340/m.64309 type:complete len:157 (+) Transcript_33340:1-471(+)